MESQGNSTIPRLNVAGLVLVFALQRSKATANTGRAPADLWLWDNRLGAGAFYTPPRRAWLHAYVPWHVGRTEYAARNAVRLARAS